MELKSALLEGSEYAVRQYHKMSSTMGAPESFIQARCAIYVHERLGIPVSIDLSHKYLKALWGFDEDQSVVWGDLLRDFRVDLVTLHLDKEGQPKVASLVELKLYTGPRAEADIQRLQALIKIAESRGELIEGYLVICEQVFPYQTMNYVRRAFDEFSKKFIFAEQKLFELEEIPGFDREGENRPGPWPVGIGVIDVRNT